MTVTDAPARTSARAAVRVPEPVGRDTLAPPSEDEKLRYADRRLWVLQIGSAISFGTLLASQVFFVTLSPWLLLLTPLLAFGVLYYLISVLVNAGTPGFDLRAHRRLVRDNTTHPSVDVFLPVCGEPSEVLANTWRYVLRMKRHYPGRVDVHVLDDSPTTGLARAALRHGFIYQRRLNRGWYKKAGNLRYAYRRSAGELILVLDADFAPRHDLLDELVPYLVADRRLGIVQSPQFFRVEPGQGWLQRGAGAVQELFYRLIQVSRQQHGAAICVGSCALYRRSALDAIGGSTLIEHSEDVHTGFDMRRKGWGLRYVPVPLAAGLCPADLRSFFTQQYRWCTGSLSLLGSTKFWNTRMSFRARLSYLSGFCYYLHTAIFAVAAPVIPVLMLTVFVEYVTLRNYLLIVPSTLYNLVVFPAWHRCRYSFETWTTKLVYGWAHFWAVWDILLQRRMGWQATGGQVRRNRTGRLRIGIAVWSAGTTGAWTLLAAQRMITDDLWAFTPAFLAGAFFLTVALQAVLVDPAADT
jgi:cellulose synthase (UDP-forming)